MTEEFREDLTSAVQRHAHSLDSEDLREAVDDLETIAEKWEAMEAL